MAETKQETQKCSRCKSTILLSYFSKNRKGEYYKTCDACREKKRKKFKCSQCDYTCGHNSTLKTHVKVVHSKIKDAQCLQCCVKFSTNGYLNHHVKTVHSKVKNHQCPQCSNKYTFQAGLRKHIKQVHDKVKDYKCSQCDYECSTNVSLKQHIKRVHDKIKDFECDNCEYKSSTKAHLQRHIKACNGGERGSAGECKIKKVLNEMRVEYEYDSTYKVKDKNMLKWDFIITGWEYSGINDDPIFIEYDGKQHFEPVNFGGMSDEKAQKAFMKCKAHDKIKDDFCTDNGYLLLRIPYTQYENIEALVVQFIRTNTNWGG